MKNEGRDLESQAIEWCLLVGRWHYLFLVPCPVYNTRMPLVLATGGGVGSIDFAYVFYYAA